MTNFAVDIGNSFTKIGTIGKDAKIDLFFKFLTERLLAGDKKLEQEIMLRFAAFEKNFSLAIASVVPEATSKLVEILNNRYPEPSIHLIKNSEIPVVNKYKDPNQVGVDRLLSAAGALNRYSAKDIIMISLGTAITIDCITSKGEFLGGIIAPGIKLSADALAKNTAQLPAITLEFQTHVLGRSTEESIQSGVMNGAVAMTSGLIAELKKEIFPESEPLILVTGGGSSEEFIKKISGDEFIEYLVLEGIAVTISTVYGRS